MSSPIGESYVTQCFNKLSEEFQTTKMECNCKKSKLKMDYPEAILLKSSKLLAEVKKSHRKRISSQYLPKYVSEYLSWKKKMLRQWGRNRGGSEDWSSPKFWDFYRKK